MAWNPNIPTVTNRVQDDLDAIRENFQHLDQLAERVDELQTVSELAERVDELQTVSELAPIANDLQTVSELAPFADDLQAVSGLAPVVEELQTVSGLSQITDDLQAVSELAPYVQAILDSRIVEMGSNANGEYVRWENGLQVCWHIVSGARSTTTVTGPLYRDDAVMMWTFPATFITSPAVYGTVAREIDGNFRAFVALQSITTTSVTYRDVATASSETLVRDDQLLALGRWK